jgi:hypothetical protein
MTTAVPSVAAWPVYLEEQLRAIPEVSSAFVGMDLGNAIRLVIFVSKYTDEILERVMDVEDRFTDLYRDQQFRFDILAMPEQGSPLDVVPGVKPIYFSAQAA